jgi:large subunit ribosomal protein L13
MTEKIYKLDAKGQSLGRLASQISTMLNNKLSVNFVKNLVVNNKVEVINASQIKVTGNKMNDTVHKNFSGYPGGLKETSLKNVVVKHGYAELIRHAVKGMLPKNKLQGIRLQNLTITE